LKRTGPRLRAIGEDARASLILSSSQITSGFDEAQRSLVAPHQIRWLGTDRVSRVESDWGLEPEFCGEQIAYLQYTSGSTSSPRGVMISHRNLVFHLKCLQQGCGYSPRSATVTWMPYYHDYGLVEGLLEPLYNATPCYVISPIAFIKRPFRWLQAISRY